MDTTLAQVAHAYAAEYLEPTRELAGQIKALEAQLAGLKKQQAGRLAAFIVAHCPVKVGGIIEQEQGLRLRVRKIKVDALDADKGGIVWMCEGEALTQQNRENRRYTGWQTLRFVRLNGPNRPVRIIEETPNGEAHA